MAGLAKHSIVRKWTGIWFLYIVWICRL